MELLPSGCTREASCVILHRPRSERESRSRVNEGMKRIIKFAIETRKKMSFLAKDALALESSLRAGTLDEIPLPKETLPHVTNPPEVRRNANG